MDFSLGHTQPRFIIPNALRGGDLPSTTFKCKVLHSYLASPLHGCNVVWHGTGCHLYHQIIYWCYTLFKAIKLAENSRDPDVRFYTLWLASMIHWIIDPEGYIKITCILHEDGDKHYKITRYKTNSNDQRPRLRHLLSQNNVIIINCDKYICV